MRTQTLGIVFTLVLAGAMAAPGMAAEPCTGFKWDVTKEVALFAGPSTAITAAKSVDAAPTVVVDRLYEAQLAPQADVAFAAPPGKKMLTDGAYAGVALLKLDAPGNYRVAVDTNAWLDLVADGKLAATRDFQGQQSCDGPHKMVEFDLSGATQYVLQLSGAAKTAIRFTVTKVPVPKG